MEVLFSFLDLKITQNKEKLLFLLILLHGVAQDTKQCPGSLASRNSHQQEQTPAPSPSNKLPQICNFGETDVVCEFWLKAANVHSTKGGGKCLF